MVANDDGKMAEMKTTIPLWNSVLDKMTNSQK